MNLIIFGPPGAGKGTQADFIVKKYNLFQLSTGEILRNEIKNKTELGIKIHSAINEGSLVSDDIVKKAVEMFISDERYKNNLATIISTLAKVEEKCKGLVAGAVWYIVKSAFDKDTLLTAVESLIGSN